MRLIQLLKRSTSRISIWSVLLLFIASTGLAFYSPLVLQAEALDNKSKLGDQVLAYTTYTAMVDCLAQETQQSATNGAVITNFRTSEADVRSGKWWKTEGSAIWGTTQGAEAPGSYLHPNVIKNNGNVLCNNIMRTAVSLYGYSDPFTFLCSFVSYRANDSSCTTGTGDFGGFKNSIDNFKAEVKKKVWNGSNPAITVNSDDRNAGQYLIYRDAFLKGCSPVESSNPGPNFKYENIRIIGNDGKETTKTYEGRNRNDQIGLFRNIDGGTVVKNCGEVAELLKGKVEAFRDYIFTNGSTDEDGNVDVGPTKPITTDCGSDTSTSTSCETPSVSTCQIEGIGWIVCPVVTFLSGIVDAAYTFVSSLLQVQPLMTTGGTGPIYTAWSTMRSIANIAFVIVFLFIIFSQLTGAGVSNYGVKKLLPRLIVGAILVNASYWICAIAIDLSNIIGVSARALFDSVGTQIVPIDSVQSLLDSKEDFDTGSGLWTGIAGTVLATATVGVAGYYAIAALAPALLAVVLAIVTVFLVLILRQALIILLVVIAPLAFVAYLLPNTESLFSKWRKFFMTLLLMYPIIAGLFGASYLASTIIMHSSSGSPFAVVIQIAGATMQIIPLALTPIVMSFAGNVLNKVAGSVNNRGPISSIKQAAGNQQKAMQVRQRRNAIENGAGQLGKGVYTRWRARRNSINTAGEAGLNRATTEYVAQQAENNASFRNQMAGGTMVREADPDAVQRALAGAINAQVKLEAEDVTAAKAIIKNANIGLEDMQKLAMGETDPARPNSKPITYFKDGKEHTLSAAVGSSLHAAAIENQFATGDVGMTDKIIEKSSEFDVKQRQVVAAGAQSMSGKVKYYGGMLAENISTGNITSSADLDAAVLSTLQEKISEQDLANQDKDALTRIGRVGAANPDRAVNLREAARALESNTEIYPTVEPRKRVRIAAIRAGIVPPS